MTQWPKVERVNNIKKETERQNVRKRECADAQDEGYISSRTMYILRLFIAGPR